jgi:hypothetical protein
MRSVCEACGSETTNRIRAACNHLCFICDECVENCPNITRDECPSCQEHEDIVVVRGKFDDGVKR